MRPEEIKAGTLKARHSPLRSRPLPAAARTPSQIARANDVNYLVHGTLIQRVEGILSAGALLPASAVPGTSHQGEDSVYLGAMGRNARGSVFPGPPDSWAVMNYRVINLVFDPAVLDEAEFHASLGWPYGKITEDSALSSEPQKLNDLFWEVSHGFQEVNEVVFHKPLSLKNLRAIWVPWAEQRAQVIQTLKKAGYVPPGGTSLEAFVVEKATWP